MTIKINELIKIGTNINNYYERLIDLEILRQRRNSEFLRTINKLREQLDQENALINELISNFNLENIMQRIKELKEKLDIFSQSILERIEVKIAFLTNKDKESKLNYLVKKDVFFISLAILDTTISKHPELADQLITSMYYSYFETSSEIEDELLRNQFLVVKSPITTLGAHMELENISTEEKDQILLEMFKEELKILLIYITKNVDLYLIEYKISILRAILVVSDNEETFIKLLEEILNDSNYEKAKEFIKRILDSINIDKEIPIRINIKVGR